MFFSVHLEGFQGFDMKAVNIDGEVDDRAAGSALKMSVGMGYHVKALFVLVQAQAS